MRYKLLQNCSVCEFWVSYLRPLALKISQGQENPVGKLLFDSCQANEGMATERC